MSIGECKKRAAQPSWQLSSDEQQIVCDNFLAIVEASSSSKTRESSTPPPKRSRHIGERGDENNNVSNTTTNRNNEQLQRQNYSWLREEKQSIEDQVDIGSNKSHQQRHPNNAKQHIDHDDGGFAAFMAVLSANERSQNEFPTYRQAITFDASGSERSSISNTDKTETLQSGDNDNTDTEDFNDWEENDFVKKMCNICFKSLGVSQYSGKQWQKGPSSTKRICLECLFPHYCRRMGEEGAREFINTAKRDNAKKEQQRKERARQQRAMKLAALAAMATQFDGQSHAFGLPIINTTTQEGLSQMKELILAKIRGGGWYYTGDSGMGVNGEIQYNEGVGFIIRDNTMICKPVRGGFVRLLKRDVGSTSDYLLQAIVHPICAGELTYVFDISYITYHYFSSNIIHTMTKQYMEDQGPKLERMPTSKHFLN